jgi:hypothetical protein
VVVEDTLEMAGAHLVELFFHCGERCRVDMRPNGCAITSGGRTLRLSLPQLARARARVLRGSLAPLGGWVSRRFDEKERAPTIVWRARISGDVVLRTEIGC